MSVDPIDLGDLHLIVDHADASPAPTAGPGDPPIPTGPWAPTVAFKACGCLGGDLCTHPCEGTRDRIELAYAPVLHLGRAA